jgi:hypothetical protein
MNIRQYLIHHKAPTDLARFADFGKQLKQQYKTFDGYAFDFNCHGIESIKFYYKIYTNQNIWHSDFANWFYNNDMFYYASVALHDSRQVYLKHKSLKALNFAIKYNLNTKKLSRAFYFKLGNKSSMVINCDGVNTSTTKYYYIYNRLLIKSINKIFNLNMPPHDEAIEFSKRKQSVHAAVFPRFDSNKPNLQDSKLHCQKLMQKLLCAAAPLGQNEALAIHCHDPYSDFITKGYSSDNKMQKIYFGCFDWEKSIFEN